MQDSNNKRSVPDENPEAEIKTENKKNVPLKEERILYTDRHMKQEDVIMPANMSMKDVEEEIKVDEEKKEKSSVLKIILLIIVPIYILCMIPLIKNYLNSESSDIGMTKEEMAGFHSDKPVPPAPTKTEYIPDLYKGNLNIEYRTEDSETAEKQKREGAAEGFFLKSLAKDDTPHNIDLIFNNDNYLDGYLQRENVKEALEKSSSLEILLRNSELVNGFLADKTVKEILSDDAKISSYLNSSFFNSLLKKNSVQLLLKDHKTLEEVLTHNKTLVRLIKKPVIKDFIVKTRATRDIAITAGWITGYYSETEEE